MGLTSAMYTGLSGMNANQTRIETIGHNISNVNTTAYKGSRTLFQTQFSQTFSHGTPPSESSGGTNPVQVGLGTLIGTTQRTHLQGAIETTGVASDIAIEGDGFFILRESGGRQVYTRDGAFSLNSNNQLVTADGDYVRGFAVDEQFNVIPGQLTDLNVPLGTLSIARATENVTMDGDLSASGTISTQGSENLSQALVTGGGQAATGATRLTDLRSANDPNTSLFADGNTITVSGVTKGDRELPTKQFVVGTDGTTLQDFATWLETALALNKDVNVPGNPGVTVENGALVIRSNAGVQNGIDITASDFSTDNAVTPLPFQFTQTADANGSGVFTSMTAYDSLGNPVTVNVTFALESTPNAGPVWRFYAESPDHQGATQSLGTGLISFDTEGNHLQTTGNQLSIDRSGTGAATPMNFSIDFSSVRGLSTKESNVVLSDQDGYPPGTLANYSVGPDGIITGAFSNGMSRTIGQVAIATFANNGGLVAEADNKFVQGPNSGTPTIVTPGSFHSGTIAGGSLELSNVDLAQEFIGLVGSSTGFQASSRVISVSNDLLNQLLLLIR